MRRNMYLTVESPTGGGNFADSPPEDWKYVLEEWFTVQALSGREYTQAQQMQSAVTHKAECEPFVGANSMMRLREASSGRIFAVASVTNRDERNRTLDWMLTEET